jgi:hypothetical protein
VKGAAAKKILRNDPLPLRSEYRKFEEAAMPMSIIKKMFSFSLLPQTRRGKDVKARSSTPACAMPSTATPP